MGKKATKLKKFLLEHPKCCFCGGAEQSTTKDHIPPRSFFIDRKHPKGFEFPACSKCNNTTSDSEDVARVLSMLQGTAFGGALLQDFVNRGQSYVRSVRERGVTFKYSHEISGDKHLVTIDDKSADSIILLARKVALGLYYNISGRSILSHEQRIELVFCTADRLHLMNKLHQYLTEPPIEPSLRNPEIARQFCYKFMDTKKHRLKNEGWRYSVLLHFHQGYQWVATFFDNENCLEAHHGIVVGPLVHTN